MICLAISQLKWEKDWKSSPRLPHSSPTRYSPRWIQGLSPPRWIPGLLPPRWIPVTPARGRFRKSVMDSGYFLKWIPKNDELYIYRIYTYWLLVPNGTTSLFYLKLASVLVTGPLHLNLLLWMPKKCPRPLVRNISNSFLQGNWMILFVFVNFTDLFCKLQVLKMSQVPSFFSSKYLTSSLLYVKKNTRLQGYWYYNKQHATCKYLNKGN